MGRRDDARGRPRAGAPPHRPLAAWLRSASRRGRGERSRPALPGAAFAAQVSETAPTGVARRRPEIAQMHPPEGERVRPDAGGQDRSARHGGHPEPPGAEPFVLPASREHMLRDAPARRGGRRARKDAGEAGAGAAPAPTDGKGAPGRRIAHTRMGCASRFAPRVGAILRNLGLSARSGRAERAPAHERRAGGRHTRIGIST
jgi:hypothetical protein